MIVIAPVGMGQPLRAIYIRPEPAILFLHNSTLLMRHNIVPIHQKDASRVVEEVEQDSLGVKC